MRELRTSGSVGALGSDPWGHPMFSLSGSAAATWSCSPIIFCAKMLKDRRPVSVTRR